MEISCWMGRLTSMYAERLHQSHIESTCITDEFAVNIRNCPKTTEKLQESHLFIKAVPLTIIKHFRPISVLPVLSKKLKRAMHKQLIQYVERNHILFKHQFGYRKKRSTDLTTILLVDNIRKKVDSGKLICAVFVLERLRLNCLDESSQNWFCDYLFNRKQFEVVNGCKSQTENVICGVPQGSILRSLLFLL